MGAGKKEPLMATNGTIISSHATSEGLITYYRMADGSVRVEREARPVLPKRVILPAA